MSSPARSISSADDESQELAELKAKHKAELREAAEKKAWKDQEHRERHEREKREKREKAEREERELREAQEAVWLGDWERRAEEQARLTEETEAVLGPLQRAGKAAAAKALEMKEAKIQAKAERDRAAFHKWWNGGAYDAERSEAEEGEVVAEPSSSEAEEDVLAQKSPRRRVIESRQNTVEVVIVRPAATGKKGLVEVAITEQVRVPDLGQQSVADADSGTLLSGSLREVPVQGGAMCPFTGARFHVYSVSGAQGALQPDPRAREEKGR